MAAWRESCWSSTRPREDEAPSEAASLNTFKGQLLKLGDAYYVAASARAEARSRIRFLCFPVGKRPSLRRRWGVVSGVAGSSMLPVAARILMTKQSKGLEPPPPQRGPPMEVGPAPEDLSFISNDIDRQLATFRESDAGRPQGLKDPILTRLPRLGRHPVKVILPRGEFPRCCP